MRDILQAKIPKVLYTDLYAVAAARSRRNHHRNHDATAIKRGRIGGRCAVLQSHGDPPRLALALAAVDSGKEPQRDEESRYWPVGLPKHRL